MVLLNRKGLLVLLILTSVASAVPIPITNQPDYWDVGGFNTSLINGTLTVDGQGVTSAPGEWGDVELVAYNQRVVKVVFGEGVESVKNFGRTNEWSGGVTLVSATFSKNIKVIKDQAFFECKVIESITILSETPPAVQGDPFPDVTKSSVTLNVPISGLAAYQSDAYWKQFDIKAIGSGINIYTITFNASGGQVTPALSSTGTDGKLAGLPTPTKLGYTFTGWFTAGTGEGEVTDNTVFTGNTAVYARWDLVHYTITYNLNDGTVSGTNRTTYTFEDETFTLINPTKADSVFAGWTWTNGMIPQKVVTIPQGSTGHRSYVANWKSDKIIIITEQPNDLALVEGSISNAVLRVAASAPGYGTISYRWYKNATKSNIGGDTLSQGGSPAYSGANSAAVTIPTGLAAGTYYYFCRLRVTDQNNNNNIIEVRSEAAKVTVGENNAPPGVITITKQPRDTALVLGNISDTVRLKVEAMVPSGYNSLIYRWYKNTSKTNSGGTRLSTGTYPSADKAELKIPRDTLKLGKYYYYCHLGAGKTNGAAKDSLLLNSEAAEILVNAQAVIKQKPTGVVFPDSATVYAGETLSTAVFAGGVAKYNGTFAFMDGATQLRVEDSGTPYAVIFTPKDSVNYYDTLISSVKVTVRKADPTVTWPASATITYGQTLGDAVLVGQSGSGTFAYSAGAMKLTVLESGNKYEMIFTPTDAARYNTLTKNVAITVNKKDGAILFANATPTAGALVYGQSLSESVLSLNDPTVGVWAWEDGTIVPTVTNTGYYAIFTPADEVNYSWAVNRKQIVKITVEKAVPKDYTEPDNLTATYGQTLSEVNIPADNSGVWSWESETALVGDIGEQTHNAKFTPNDMANYEIKTGIPLIVTVGKGTPGFTVPTGLTATYGEHLKDVAFPTDDSGVWSWVDGSTLVGAVGTRTHSAKFTPEDNVRYEAVTDIAVSITVSKADPTGVAWPTSATITYGQTLADAVFVGGDIVTTGAFAYTAGTARPTVSQSGTKYEVTFTPNDSANYNKLTHDVAITVNKASGLAATDPEIIMVSVADPGPHTFDLSAIGLNKADHGALSYEVKEFDNDDDVLHSEPEITGSTLTYTGAGKESGTATQVIAIESENYTDAEVTVIFKATPKTAVVIGGLTAENSTYDGTAKRGVTGTATSGYYTGDLVYAYTGTGITEPTATLPINAGAYTLTVSVPSDNAEYTGSKSYMFTIAKAVVTKPTVANTSFIYNGSERSLGVVANVNYTVTGDKATNVGTYAATVVLKDKTNYQWADNTIADLSLAWSIVKASYDMSGISFTDKTVNFDGDSHSIEISGTLPSGVTVSYGNNGKTAAGEYTVTATFAVADPANYIVPASKTAKLTIRQTYLITVNSGTSDKSRAVAGETVTVTADAAPVGKVFDKWTASGVTIVNDGVTTTFAMPAATVTVTATYKPITYTVTWRTNGGTPAPTNTSVNYGDTIKVPAAMTRTGYNFGGWYTDTLLMTAASLPMVNVTSAKTFYAKWTASVITYTIKLNANGGTITPAADTTVKTNADGKLASLPTPVRIGYFFEGWYTTVSTGGALVQAASNVFDTDATIYARWTLIYTITFNPNGGTITTSTAQTGAGGKLAAPLPEPAARPNYIFNGWYTDTVSAPGTKVDANYVFSGTNAAVTVYARWTPPVTYTITFNPSGGAVSPTSRATGANGKLASLPTPARTGGYVFNGWYTDTTSTPGTKVDTNRVYSANASIYARWLYTITFNVNGTGGTVSLASAVTGANGKLDTLPTPVRNNYAFAGWYTTDAATGGTVITKDHIFSGPATIYARWTPAYTITFSAGEGGTVSPASAQTGADGKLASLPIPTRTGYTYIGWYTTPTGNTQVTADYAFTAAATIYARWSSAYTVTFDANGGPAFSQTTGTTGTDGKLASLPAAPARTGYVFDGWYTTAATGGAKVTTSYVFTAPTAIYARWSPVYTITFNANGGPAASPATAVTGADGKLASLPAMPARTGYVFDGWYTTNAATGGAKVTTDYVFTAAATVYARWTPAYTITFNAGSGTVTPATAVTGADGKLASLPTPARSGYLFDGWYTTNAATGGTKVTEDYVFSGTATVYARWTLVTYTITFDPNGGTVSVASGVTGTGGRLASLPTPAARTGYNFGNWYTAETGGTQVTTSTVFSEDAVIYARWTPISYTITYTLNGGTATPANPTSYNIESADITLNNPIRANYIFDGWTGANGTAKQTEVTIPKGSIGAKSYTANWTAIVYTIYFDVNGGAKLTPDSAKTAAGGRLAFLPVPTLKDYTFLGWFTEAEGGTKVTTGTVFNDDAVIYAQWSLFTHAKVTFGAVADGTLRAVVDGVQIASGDSVAIGKSVVFTAVPDDGYKVAGWTINGKENADTVFTYVLTGLSNATVVSVSFERRTSVASQDREIPDVATIEEAAVAPARALSGVVTVGPNPVRAGGGAAIYLNGGKAVSGSLFVFDAVGGKAARINVKGVGKIGTWKTDGIAEGTYLIKGVLTDKNGVKVKVSAPVGVVR